jgi:uncharacterized protein (TIGR04255 family)
MTDTVSPEFAAPPVEEVALGAYFQPISGLRSTHLNAIHDLWRDDYPDVEELPLAPPIPEVVGGRPEIKLEISTGTPASRYMFRSSDGRQLIQLQRDRIVHNWRKLQPTDAYPRYKSLLPRFLKAYDRFVQYADDNGLGPVQPQKCEVLYVNLIDDSQTVLAPWSGRFSDDFLGKPEVFAAEMRFAIRDDDGAERGHLFVTTAPALHQETGESRFLLQLMARGDTMPPSRGGVENYLDLGHKWVVNGFVSATKGEMHGTWGMA